MAKTFQARSVTTERLTLEEFMERRTQQPQTIKRARIVPPSLTDDDDYGSFVVELKTPRYEVEL